MESGVTLWKSMTHDTRKKQNNNGVAVGLRVEDLSLETEWLLYHCVRTQCHTCSSISYHHHYHISLLLSTAEHRPPQLTSNVTGPMPPRSLDEVVGPSGRLTLRFAIRGMCYIHFSIFLFF